MSLQIIPLLDEEPSIIINTKQRAKQRQVKPSGMLGRASPCSSSSSAANSSRPRLYLSGLSQTPNKTVDRSHPNITANSSNARTPKDNRAVLSLSCASNLALATKLTNGKTPNKSKTPKGGKYANDRFIPSRDDLDNIIQLHAVANMCNPHHPGTFHDENLLPTPNRPLLEEFNSSVSPKAANLCPQNDFSASLASALFQGEDLSSRVLSFKTKAPKPSENFSQTVRATYAANKEANPQPKKKLRVAEKADKVLDAPEMADDFYLNLLDWSCQDVVAVGLNRSVYLYNPNSYAIEKIYESKQPSSVITSVSFASEGTHLAVGLSSSEVMLFDIMAGKQLRNMRGHGARVSALSWNRQMLSSASRSSAIFNHDVRQNDHHISSLMFHTGEVCGLKWSPDGKQLASGANDNMCAIWDVTSCAQSSTVAAEPIYTFTESQAAVKALAWCPSQRHLLATGSGTNDGHIRFYHTGTGSVLNSVNTNSQVCSLQWAKDRMEVLSSHGYSLVGAANVLNVWKYPTMTKVGELHGHAGRVFHTASSPDGSTVVSAGPDETVRFWRVWEARQKEETKVSRTDKGVLAVRNLVAQIR